MSEEWKEVKKCRKNSTRYNKGRLYHGQSPPALTIRSPQGNLKDSRPWNLLHQQVDEVSSEDRENRSFKSIVHEMNNEGDINTDSAHPTQSPATSETKHTTTNKEQLINDSSQQSSIDPKYINPL